MLVNNGNIPLYGMSQLQTALFIFEVNNCQNTDFLAAGKLRHQRNIFLPIFGLKLNRTVPGNNLSK